MTPLFPEQASTFAGNVDALYLFLIAVTAFFSLLIGTLVVVFALKYRRTSPDEIAQDVHESGLLDMRINLRRRHFSVPHHRQHRSEVGSVVQQMRRKRMPDDMRA